MPKIKVPFFIPDKEGKTTTEMKTGELVKVAKCDEPWSEYTLEDGTLIRTKQTALHIVKMDELGPDGNPIYSIQTQPSLVVIPSEK